MLTRVPKKYQYTVLSLFWLFIFSISATSSYLYFSFQKVIVAPSPVATQSPFPLPFTTPKPDNTISVLLLGYGGGNHSGGTLSDAIILLHINPDTKKAYFISIPRDTWISLPISEGQEENFKINAAYAIGGDDKNYPNKPVQFTKVSGAGELAKYAVSNVTGLTVANFISVSFSGFKESIDILGGIDVNVPVTFNDYFYPLPSLEDETCGLSPETQAAINATMSGFELEKQYTCRYEHLYFARGLNHMNGETVLKFVRSRHSDEHGSDFARSERQRAVLDAIKSKSISLGALDDIVEFINLFSNTVKTDIDAPRAQEIVSKIGNPEDYTVTNIFLNTDNVFNNSTSNQRAYILIPKSGANNWNSIHTYIKEIISK